MWLEQIIEFKINLFAVGNFIAFLANILIAKIAYDRRKQRGAFPLAMWILAISFWLLMATFQYSAFDLRWNIFWAKMMYWGIVQIPIWFVFFAWSFTGHSHYITRRNVLLHLIVPILSLILVWTNESHHLIWTQYEWLEDYKAWRYGQGTGLYLIVVGYIYPSLVYGSFYFLRMIRRNYREMGIQSIFILVGLAVPWVGSILSLINASNTGLDSTPLMLTLSGWFFIFALFRLHLLNVVNVARAEVIEVMSDGVLIIDDRNVILDFNPAIKNLIGKAEGLEVGNTVDSGLIGYPELLEQLIGDATAHEVVLYTELGNRKHEVTISPLYYGKAMVCNSPIARMILLRDITMTAKAKELLAEKNQKLEDQLAQNETLREQLQQAVIRDALTGLYNRRFFQELASKEVAAAKRHNRGLCMMIFDIDNFKIFNDSYGHLAGDEVLRVFGKFLMETARQGDIVCRYGGEEFVAVFPDTSPDLIDQRARALLQEVRKLPVFYEGSEYHITISVGIGSYPRDGAHVDAILKAADMRMYRAKQNGRDQLWSYKNDEQLK